MAKTYINTLKYLVRIKFEIDGIVDKPDIVGAIFGQSEGLLGDEMDLKELQKNGKLGRIEINFSTSMGRTKGEVLVPSSMDMAETSLLAAGIESVDKVGPCEAKLEIVDIEDTRNDKRKEIKDRAKELLKRLMDKSSPDTQSLSEEIRENARAADIVEYGPDKLPAGPNIDTSEEILVVEGRADVLNLLRNQIKNVVGMNGSNIPQTIIDLSNKGKRITAFVDGDRGGDLNARKLAQLARIEFISKAPDGKEVEELTRKEILLSLKKRVPAKEFLSQENGFHTTAPERRFEGGGFRGGGMRTGMRPARSPGFGFDRGLGRGRDRRMGGGRDRMGPRSGGYSGGTGFERPNRGFDEEVRPFENYGSEAQPSAPQREPVLSSEETAPFKPIIDSLKGSAKAQILGEGNTVLKEVKVKDVVEEIAKAKGTYAVVFDGVVTKRLVEAAEKAGAKYVIGARKGKIETNGKVKVAAL